MEAARAASAADLDRVASLWARAIEEVTALRGGQLLARSWHRDNLEAELAAILACPDRHLVVGQFEQVTVGFASAACDKGSGAAIGVVELLYVEPPARQVGVGEAMLEELLSWCRRMGCAGVDAPALPGSRAAKSFFEDNGFVARLLVMHRPLTSATDGDG